MQRPDVRQRQINVETMFCMLTLKFTTLNNAESTSSVSMVTLTVLDKVETTLSFSKSSFTTSKQRWEYDHLQKVEKNKIFNLQSAKISFFHYKPRISRRARCEICSKLTIKTPEYVKLTIKLKIKTGRSGLFIVNFEHISLLVTMFQLLTLIS